MRNRYRRNLLRLTQVRGGRVRAPEGISGREMGVEGRSGKNAIIRAWRCRGRRSGKNVIVGASRREKRRRVRAPDREAGRRRRRRGKARRRSSVKDAIVLDCQWPLDTKTADQPTPLDGERGQP